MDIVIFDIPITVQVSDGGELKNVAALYVNKDENSGKKYYFCYVENEGIKQYESEKIN